MRYQELFFEAEELNNKLRLFAKQTKEELDLEEFSLNMIHGNIMIFMLIVKKENQKKGTGSEALRRLVDFADQHGKRIILSPAEPDDDWGTTSRSRLVKFYKRFGFYENKGRKKDFSISNSMIREPLQIENLNEGRNTPSIVVDVQPSYEENGYGESNFSIFRNISRFLNEQRGPILMFVNAEDQGMTQDTIADIKVYWEEKLGFSDWGRVEIIDKGYGYFRSWMDGGIKDSDIIKTIRLMYQSKVGDSRELFPEEPDYEYAMEQFLHSDYENWDDALSVNWTSVAQLKRFSGAYIMGGAREECLKEVELLMNAFNIKYKRIEDFIYG